MTALPQPVLSLLISNESEAPPPETVKACRHASMVETCVICIDFHLGGICPPSIFDPKGLNRDRDH